MDPGTRTAHVLLIEGDPDVRASIEQGLSDEGFTVSSVGDGEAGLKLVDRSEVDLLMLDLTLPKIGGIEVLRRVRELKPRLPIFALSNLDETGPMVIGLESGADEYITKPVSVPRLAALVRARLRRGAEEGSLSIGPLTLDLAAHRAAIGGRDVDLSAREVSLLATFMRHEGEVLSKKELLKTVWNVEFDPGSNVVSVYVRSLRKKIGRSLIQTVRGSGYRLRVPPARAE